MRFIPLFQNWNLHFMHIQENIFNLIKLLREVDVVVVRILKALYLVPEQVELTSAVVRDLLNGGTVVNALAVSENLNKQLLCRGDAECLPCTEGSVCRQTQTCGGSNLS